MEPFITGVVFMDSAVLVFCLGYLMTEKLARGVRPERLVWLGGLAPKPKREAIRIKQSLVQAGYRNASATALFYGWSAASTVLLPGLFGLSLVLSGQRMAQAFLAASIAAIVGYLAPRWALRSQVRVRQEKIRRALPEMLDLMIVCVEVGMGLDQSFAKVGERLRASHPEIAEELGRVLLEMRAGRPRAEAFYALVQRTGLEAMGALVATVVHADRFGTSLAQSLRLYAEEFRTRRRQRAEEMAAKIPVKLVFPIVFFIFPAIVVITAGPAILRLIKELLPMIRG